MSDMHSITTSVIRRGYWWEMTAECLCGWMGRGNLHTSPSELKTKRILVERHDLHVAKSGNR